MQNQPMQIDKKEFKELLKEIQKYNKLDLLAQGFQTKYAREAVGVDDEQRRKDAIKTNELLESILLALSGTKDKASAKVVSIGAARRAREKNEEDRPRTFQDVKKSVREDLSKFKGELKTGVALTKRVGGGIGDAVRSFVRSPLESMKSVGSSIADFGKSAYGQAKDVLSTPSDYKNPMIAALQRPSAAAVDNPNIVDSPAEKVAVDNPNIVDSPTEKVAEENEKQSASIKELLNVTKESLDQLKAIRGSLEGAPATRSAQPASKTPPAPVAPAPAPAAAEEGGSVIGDIAGAATSGIGGKIMGGLKAGGAMLGKGALAAGKLIGGAALAKPALIAAGVGLAAYGAYKGYKALTGDKKDQQAPGMPQEPQQDPEKARAAAREQYQTGKSEEKAAQQKIEAFRKENPYDYREKPTAEQEFLEMPGTGKFKDQEKQAEYDKLKQAQTSAYKKTKGAEESYRKSDKTQDKILTKGGREIPNIGGIFKKLDVLVNRFGYSKTDFLNEDGKSYSMDKVNAAYEKEIKKDLESPSKDKEIEPKLAEAASPDTAPAKEGLSSEAVSPDTAPAKEGLSSEAASPDTAPAKEGPSFSERLKSFFGFGNKEEPPVEGRQAGGPVTEGRPYIVGEKGPEVVVPSQNATVVPKNKKAAKSVPQIVETIDMGDGSKKEILDDGSYVISGAEGTTKYSAKGAKLSYTSPQISGLSMSEDYTTGESELRYAAGGLYASERRNKAGELIRTEASYDTGSGRMSMVEAGGKRTSSFELRDGSEQNAILKEERTSGQIQPIISNNVSNNTSTTYMPAKADPRPTHKGSALERYNERVAAY